MEKIAKIKFGKLGFEFFINSEVKEFISKKNIEIQKLIPTAGSWYKFVIKEINLDYNQRKNVQVLFFRDKIKNIKKNFKPEKIIQSPLRIEDGEYLLKIGVKKNEK
jgi:hypothetical protein